MSTQSIQLAAEVGAWTGADAAIVATLAPGIYTVVLKEGWTTSSARLS